MSKVILSNNPDLSFLPSFKERERMRSTYYSETKWPL